MRVLVGYESSGIVRDAFIALGHDAMSCDLLPSKRPGPHYQGDIFDIIGESWDLGIFHPVCTYLCGSGQHWNRRRPERAIETEKAVEHVGKLWAKSIHIKKRATENPVGILSTRFRKPDQIIQPNQFGHDASKATCLWLENLPLLVPTKHIDPRWVCSACKTVHPKTRFAPRCQCGAFEKQQRPRWENQTDSGQNRLGPSADRWQLRAETYPGIAAAFAEQWGGVVEALP